MAQTKPFTERFTEMLSIALLRNGILVQGAPYRVSGYDSFHQPDPDAYRRVGLRFREDPSALTLAPRPSLVRARCSTCRSRMVVVDVRETQTSRFAGTFTGDETFTHATGRLVCAKDASHGRAKKGHSFFDELTVVVDATLGEMVSQLDGIAHELGY